MNAGDRTQLQRVLDTLQKSIKGNLLKFYVGYVLKVICYLLFIYLMFQ